MPEWMMSIIVAAIVTTILGTIVTITGYFLRKAFNSWIDTQTTNQDKIQQKQDEFIAAINNLNTTLIKLDAKIELYKSHSDTLSKNIDELKEKHENLADKHDAMNIRLIGIEKQCVSNHKDH